MKKKQRPEPMVGPSTTIFKFFVSILLNENRTKGENERENMYEQKRKGEEIIVVMASRRRAMKELGRVTFPPDTTSGGGSPRASLERRVSLERKIVFLNMKRKKEKIVKNDKKYKFRKTQKVKNDETIYSRKTYIKTHN